MRIKSKEKEIEQGLNIPLSVRENLQGAIGCSGGTKGKSVKINKTLAKCVE